MATNLTVTATQDTQPAHGVCRVQFTVLAASAPTIVQDTTPTGITHHLCWTRSDILGNFTGVATHLLPLAV